jgi:hypothetical protein
MPRRFHNSRRLIRVGELGVAGSSTKLSALQSISGAGVLETFVADVSDAKQFSHMQPGLSSFGERSMVSSTMPASKRPCDRSLTFPKKTSIA